MTQFYYMMIKPSWLSFVLKKEIIIILTVINYVCDQRSNILVLQELILDECTRAQACRSFYHNYQSTRDKNMFLYLQISYNSFPICKKKTSSCSIVLKLNPILHIKY